MHWFHEIDVDNNENTEIVITVKIKNKSHQQFALIWNPHYYVFPIYFPRNSIVHTSFRHRYLHFQRFSILPDILLDYPLLHLILSSLSKLLISSLATFIFFLFISALFYVHVLAVDNPCSLISLISHFPLIGLCTTFYRLIHFCVHFVWMIDK